MKYQTLLKESKAHLEKHHCDLPVPLYCSLFSAGAYWMYDRLQELQKDKTNRFPGATHYNWYGVVKYGIALLMFCVAVVTSFKINILLLPLSVVVFYLAEVHFLFLFPLLLDEVPHPVRASIRLTYRTGLLTALVNTIPIGFFMMAGLLNRKKPLQNWYVGSLAILIWYNHEMGNRLPASV